MNQVCPGMGQATSEAMVARAHGLTITPAAVRHSYDCKNLRIRMLHRCFRSFGAAVALAPRASGARASRLDAGSARMPIPALATPRDNAPKTQNFLERNKKKFTGQTGAFGNKAFSHDIIHQTGGRATPTNDAKNPAPAAIVCDRLEKCSVRARNPTSGAARLTIRAHTSQASCTRSCCRSFRSGSSFHCGS
jgi:hypothetical protein